MTRFKILLLGAVSASAALCATGAAAQTTSVAVVDPAAAILSAKAIAPAWNAIDTQYKAAYDAASARQRTLQAAVEPLSKKLDTNNNGQVDQNELAAAQAAKRPELQQILTLQQAAEQDIGRGLQPARLAQAWVLAQVRQKYPAALQSVATTKRLGIVMTAGDTPYFQPAADITDDVTAAINAALPTATTTPPANFQADEQLAQLYQQLTQAIANQARAGAAQGAARPAATTPPATTPPARPQGR